MARLTDGTIALPGGRRLAYTEWGNPKGYPVLYFHGTPGSRLWCPDESATMSADVRLIMPDRPGIVVGPRSKKGAPLRIGRQMSSVWRMRYRSRPSRSWAYQLGGRMPHLVQP